MAIESEQLATGGGGGAEIGSVINYTADLAPDGYLLCDGSVLDRTVYADLYAIIGDSFGNGDGATTFQIPDFRGKFLRGTDKAAANDPDRLTRTASGTGGNVGDNIGSSQVSGNKNHRHTGSPAYLTSSTTMHIYGGYYSNAANRTGTDFNNSSTGYSRGYTSTDGDSTESRPINVNINYMIKY